MKLNVSRKQFEKEIRELRKSLNEFVKKVVMMNWREERGRNMSTTVAAQRRRRDLACINSEFFLNSEP